MIPSGLRKWPGVGRLSWIPLALSILGLSAVLAGAALWLLRGDRPSQSGSSLVAQASARPSEATVSGSAVTEKDPAPEPAQAALRPNNPPPATASAAASLPLPKTEMIASDPAAFARSGSSAGPALRVASASADVDLSPQGRLMPPAPEPVPSAPSISPVAPRPMAAIEPPQTGLSSDESQRLATRANGLLKQGDIAGARLLLTRAASAGGAQILFALAETYDPKVLASWNVRGIKPDADKAKALYRQASEGGLAEARDRIEALR